MLETVLTISNGRSQSWNIAVYVAIYVAVYISVYVSVYVAIYVAVYVSVYKYRSDRSVPDEAV